MIEYIMGKLIIYALCLLISLQFAIIVPSETNNLDKSRTLSDDNISSAQLSARESFALPRLSDFEDFKLLFKKNYSSMTENLFRKRIYLSKSFRAFVSSVKYKFGRLDHYFAINQMSDWSQKELNRIMLDQKSLKLLDMLKQPIKTDEEIRIKRDVETESADETPNNQLVVVQEILDEKGQESFDKELPGDISVESPNGSPANRATSIAVDLKKKRPQHHDWDARNDAKLTKQNPLSPIYQKTYAMISRLGAVKRVYTRDRVFIDHRRSNCFVPVKSQGRCGSCFIFTAMALYEWHYCKTVGHRQEFSEQYVIDCGDKTGIKGCDGGAFYDISRFVDEFGLEISTNFPNTNLPDQQCPYSDFVNFNSMGYIRPRNRGEFVSIPVTDIDDFLRQAPIAMGVNTNEEFFDYGGGVDRAKRCRDSESVHAMLLVGSGRQDGQNYWLFRNSFSTNWGENGYYKLNRKSIECIHVSVGAALDVDFKPSLLANVNKKYDGSPVQSRKSQLMNTIVPIQALDTKPAQ